MVYTVISEPPRGSHLSTTELRSRLEKGADIDKIVAMRQVLVMMLNGDALPNLLMDVIRFVLPSKDKQLKKLLYRYWEMVPKLGPDGKLRHEMILVCNAVRNDLQHPNEYVRGGTLRFLAKIKEPELLEPLMPTIRACLDHRHAYVRKNAVLTILAIAQNPTSSHLLPDATELLVEFLANENDSTCARNAFVAISRLDRDAAYAYFHENYTQFTSLDEQVQLAFIAWMRQDSQPAYVAILESCLDSTDPAVTYAAANALSSMSSSPPLLASVAKKYVDIAVAEPDNNIKVISLNRVEALNKRAPGALSGLVMDVLLVLSTPDISVRKQALDLALELVTGRSVDEVIRLLKRELQTVGNYDNSDEYRQAIISAIHRIAIDFEEVTASVVDLLLEFLGDFNAESALSVVTFIKEIVELFPNLRSTVVSHLLANLGSVRTSRAYLGTLWVLGEYCDDTESAWSTLCELLGPLPLTEPVSEISGSSGSAEPQATSTKPKVLADGTYATETAFDVPTKVDDGLHLRRLIVTDRDYFLADALAACITKLALRAQSNARSAEAILIMTSLLRLESLNEDAYERIYGCISLILNGSSEEKQIFLTKPHEAFASLVENERVATLNREKSEQSQVAVDEPVRFRLLPQETTEEESDIDVVPQKVQSQLKQVNQLTGYSDPVYAEALLTVNQTDIILDVMLFNQTTDTLQNLAVEFFTCGDLKVLESSPSANIPPMSFHTARTTIRVSSADSGVIFGNIAYEGKTAGEGTVVILNEIRLNILDYIRPAKCSSSEFLRMWSEFEWENKVAISSSETSLGEHLESVKKATNMACLNPAPEPEAQFMSVNLYARSCFGEDALANLSVELSGGHVVGHIRIRAKTQGPALSIGDRVTDMEREAS